LSSKDDRILTPKSLSPWEIILITKIIPNIFLHGSLHILRNKGNASLDLKKRYKKPSYKNFKVFDKHMSKIMHLECTNIKKGNFCLKLWQNIENPQKTNETLPMQLNLTTKVTS
jgi:hypothetical protein